MAKGIMRFVMLSFCFMFVIYTITALEIGTSTGTLGVGGSRGVVLDPPSNFSFKDLNNTPDSYATAGGNCCASNFFNITDNTLMLVNNC